MVHLRADTYSKVLDQCFVSHVMTRGILLFFAVTLITLPMKKRSTIDGLQLGCCLIGILR